MSEPKCANGDINFYIKQIEELTNENKTLKDEINENNRDHITYSNERNYAVNELKTIIKCRDAEIKAFEKALKIITEK